MSPLALLVLAFGIQDSASLVRSAEYKYKTRDVEGALADYERAISVDPGCAAAYAGRGQIRVNKGELEKGLADYTKSIELDPKQSKVFFSRAILRTYRGDEEGALADYTKALDNDPT